MTAPAAPRSFRGECPKCDKMATHEEFIRDRRMAASQQAVARMDFKQMTEYAFRCSACGQRNEKVLDDQGALHKWQGNRHIVLRVD